MSKIEDQNKIKYAVEFNTVYKWVKIRQTWVVEAEGEEEALALVNSGEGDYDPSSEVILSKDKEVSDEHIYTYKI